MEPATTLASFREFGLVGMMFYMWYMQNQKDSSQKNVIEQQVKIIEQLREDKQKDADVARQERAEFIAIVKDNTAALQRNSDQLQQIKCVQ